MDVPEKVETEVKSPYREVLEKKETKKKHCYNSDKRNEPGKGETEVKSPYRKVKKQKRPRKEYLP